MITNFELKKSHDDHTFKNTSQILCENNIASPEYHRKVEQKVLHSGSTHTHTIVCKTS